MVDPTARTETTDLPGATKSGLANPSPVGPTPEKVASVSSPMPAVVWSSLAPAVMTNGSSPGAAIVPGAVPPLPAAVTTTTPEFHTRSTATSTGSFWYPPIGPPASD